MTHLVHGGDRMNVTTSAERLLHLFANPPADGISGVMDGLVEMARGTALRLECRGGALWGQVAGGSPIEIPLRRPIFRAGLSRIAVRCESARGTSVSPYGGAGQIVLGGDAPARVRVTFVNTPDQQMLELIDERVLDRVFSPAESSTNGSTQPSTEPSRTRD